MLNKMVILKIIKTIPVPNLVQFGPKN